MKNVLKFILPLVIILLMSETLHAQGCSLPYKYARKLLTQSSLTLMTFVADQDRLIFDIDAYRYTNSVGHLSIFVDGILVKGVAIKKGSFDTYFALRNLNGKHVEIKGHKASATNKREVKIYVKKQMSIYNKTGQIASGSPYVARIRPTSTVSFSTFGSCTSNARLVVNVTNENTANMVVRVRENHNNGPVIHTFNLGGNVKNFIRTINSNKPLHIEITNTNGTMRKDIKATVRYTN